MSLASQYRVSSIGLWGIAVHGLVLAQHGDLERGVDHVRRALDEVRAGGGSAPGFLRLPLIEALLAVKNYLVWRPDSSRPTGPMTR